MALTSDRDKIRALLETRRSADPVTDEMIDAVLAVLADRVFRFGQRVTVATPEWTRNAIVTNVEHGVGITVIPSEGPELLVTSEQLRSRKYKIERGWNV